MVHCVLTVTVHYSHNFHPRHNIYVLHNSVHTVFSFFRDCLSRMWTWTGRTYLLMSFVLVSSVGPMHVFFISTVQLAFVACESFVSCHIRVVKAIARERLTGIQDIAYCCSLLCSCYTGHWNKDRPCRRLLIDASCNRFLCRRPSAHATYTVLQL